MQPGMPTNWPKLDNEFVQRKADEVSKVSKIPGEIYSKHTAIFETEHFVFKKE